MPLIEVYKRTKQCGKGASDMKTYNFTADITFDAENIDQVYRKLYNHFVKLRKGRAEYDPWFIGEMKCKVIKEGVDG